MLRKQVWVGLIFWMIMGLFACVKTTKDSVESGSNIYRERSGLGVKEKTSGYERRDIKGVKKLSPRMTEPAYIPECVPSPKGSVPINRNRNLNIPQAGEHDDNEEPAYFLKFLKDMRVDALLTFSVEKSRLLTVLDQNREALWNVQVKSGKTSFQTAQDGEVLLLNPTDRITLKYNGFETNLKLTRLSRRDEVVLPLSRNLSPKLKADIVFIMDTTGSMGDEIEMLRDTVYSIYMRLKDFNSGNIELRFGMVLYRDQGDEYVTRVVPFTGKIEKLQEDLFKVSAGGGGDYPEDLVSGLQAAYGMNWKKDAIKLAFVVTDAPAHIKSFAEWVGLAKKALLSQIKIFSIGASGLDSEGEVQLRSLSQLSRGKFIFLTYGETGNSSGSGTADDPGKVSHHTGANYTSRNLDDIVVDNVRNELSYQLSPDALAKIRKNYDYKGAEDEVQRRVDNALKQIQKQIADKSSAKTLNVLMLPPLISDDSLAPLSEHIVNVAQTLNQKEKYFTWVDRQFTADILKELKLKLAGFTDGDKLPQMKSVDVILGGKLYFIGRNSVLFLKAVDAQKSTILAATMVEI